MLKLYFISLWGVVSLAINHPCSSPGALSIAIAPSLQRHRFIASSPHRHRHHSIAIASSPSPSLHSHRPTAITPSLYDASLHRHHSIALSPSLHRHHSIAPSPSLHRPIAIAITPSLYCHRSMTHRSIALLSK